MEPIVKIAADTINRCDFLLVKNALIPVQWMDREEGKHRKGPHSRATSSAGEVFLAERNYASSRFT